jgi:hypothetical protein
MLARKGIRTDRFARSLPKINWRSEANAQCSSCQYRAYSDDKEFFAGKIWQLMTSCYERRENDYERLGWWEFTGADGRSQAYADLLARGLTRTLVAARAKTASTKTGGDIFLQLIFNMANPSVATDRILNGPDQ